MVVVVVGSVMEFGEVVDDFFLLQLVLIFLKVLT
jgi:hypothetical protein